MNRGTEQDLKLVHIHMPTTIANVRWKLVRDQDVVYDVVGFSLLHCGTHLLSYDLHYVLIKVFVSNGVMSKHLESISVHIPKRRCNAVTLSHSIKR